MNSEVYMRALQQELLFIVQFDASYELRNLDSNGHKCCSHGNIFFQYIVWNEELS